MTLSNEYLDVNSLTSQGYYNQHKPLHLQFHMTFNPTKLSLRIIIMDSITVPGVLSITEDHYC